MRRLLCSILTIMTFALVSGQTPEQMEVWQKNMMPNENHKWLSMFDGRWKGEMKIWMSPSQPPTTSELNTVNEMIMNNLFQKSTHIGNMMGMEFRGEGLVGFDNLKKVFTSTWIDNMSSSISYMTGTLSEDKKILTMTGTMADAMSGKDLEMKQVLTIINENKHLFEMFMTVEGREVKTMEILYSR